MIIDDNWRLFDVKQALYVKWFIAEIFQGLELGVEFPATFLLRSYIDTPLTNQKSW